jgi:hypothetical protein
MALQSFVDKVGPVISAAWLNMVDALSTTVFQNASTSPGARAALFTDAPLEVVNGGTGLRAPLSGHVTSVFTVTSSITTQPVPGLTINNIPVGYYAVDTLLCCNGVGGGDGGIRIGFTFTIGIGQNQVFPVAWSQNGFFSSPPANPILPSVYQFAPITTAPTVSILRYFGFIQVTSPGSFTWQVAQSTSSANSLQVFDSYFLLTPV